MKIYISGKVSGLKKEDVIRRFGNAESLLTEIGFDVVNPLKNGLDFNAPWDEHMVRDIKLLFSCDAVFMMDGWLDSTGAQIEYDIATRMGKTIWFESVVVRTNQRIQRIKNAIHSVTGLQMDEYQRKGNKTMLSYARMIFAHHCREFKMTLVTIGNYLHRDHSSVLYLINQYDDARRFNPVFARIAAHVEEIIGNDTLSEDSGKPRRWHRKRRNYRKHNKKQSSCAK